MNFEINPDVLLVVVLAALSLFFDYFPGVSQKFDALDTPTKRLITAGLAAFLGVAAFVGQCFSLFSTNLVCDVKSAWDLLYGVIFAVAVMYGFHKSTKPTSKAIG